MCREGWATRLRCAPLIAVMETTDFWDCDDRAGGCCACVLASSRKPRKPTPDQLPAEEISYQRGGLGYAAPLPPCLASHSAWSARSRSDAGVSPAENSAIPQLSVTYTSEATG